MATETSDTNKRAAESSTTENGAGGAAADASGSGSSSSIGTAPGHETKRVRLDEESAIAAAATATATTPSSSAKSSPDKHHNQHPHQRHEQKRGGGKQRGGRGNIPGRRERSGRDEEAQGAAAAAAEASGDDGEGGVRLPKRKVAIHFGYCGIGYSGLQINHDVKTIEGDIFAAFCKLGAISKDNAVNPNKVSLQRAARTDRGVHAAGNLLTMKLILEPSEIGPGELVKAANEKLPDLIRIWGFTRVQNSFNARTSCDSRQYEYLLPTYVFLPPKPGTHMWNTMKRWQAPGTIAGASAEAEGKSTENDDEYRSDLDFLLNHPFWRKQGTEGSFAEDTAAKKKWRIPAKQLERVRKIFAHYEGSHNFHNFTVGKPFRDRSAHRHMIKLTISEPKIINGCEWLSIKFHGQSFMLHQIRKMIGLLVLVGRSSAPDTLVPETFGPARIHVPKAPGLGLLLEEPIFAGYNRKLLDSMKRQGETPEGNNKGDGGVLKEPVEFERYGDKMEQFKQTWIYDRIHQEEEEKHEYVKFLQYLDVLAGPDFEYLNPKGVIPQESILRVGEQVRPQFKKSAAGGEDSKGNGFKGAAAVAAAGAGAAGAAATIAKNGDEAAEEAAEESAQESDDDEEMLKGNLAELEG